MCHLTLSPNETHDSHNSWECSQGLVGGPRGSGDRIRFWAASPGARKGSHNLLLSGYTVPRACAADIAFSIAKTRMAFGKRLCEFQAIQFMLVDMNTEIEAARAMHYDGCARADRGEHDAKIFPMTHNFANSVAIKISDMALEVFGGHAVLDWAHPLCRVMRDIRSTCIAAGGGPNMKRMVSARELFA